MIDVTQAINELGITDWVMRGTPTNEQEFLQMFKKIVGVDENQCGIESSNSDDFGVTWEEIQAKIQELQAAEPLRLLRLERTRLLNETDWEVTRGIEEEIDITELKTYRSALRNLPQEIEAGNIEAPTLNENGELVFNSWPVRE